MQAGNDFAVGAMNVSVLRGKRENGINIPRLVTTPFQERVNAVLFPLSWLICNHGYLQ